MANFAKAIRAPSAILRCMESFQPRSFPPFRNMLGILFRCFVLASLLSHFLFGIALCQDFAKPNEQLKVSSTPIEPWPSLPLGLDPTQVIDLALGHGYLEHAVCPSRSIDDVSFARRLYLDLIGRVPKPTEVQEFLAQTESTKRAALIDHLLVSDEHAEHLAEVLDAILIGRTNADQVKKRTDSGWIAYLQNAVHDNRPWSQVAREVVLARPTNPEARGASWYLYSRKDKHQDIAEAVSKDIFGVRIDCAQCHDHPLADEIKQKHYWGLVAFFNRSKNADTPAGPRISESAIGGFSDFANLEGSSSPNELRFLQDRYVDEMRPAKDVKEEERDDLYVSVNESEPKVPKFSRREQFVEKVLADHPLLAKAMVNRLWAWMMGRGLVHPVDSIDSFHPASHPQLLDWLSRDFASSGYDVRRLIKALASTKAYQLSSSNLGNSDPKWFATALPKPLTAEMLQRSMLVVLDPLDPDKWNAIEHRVAFANLFPDVLAEESIANAAQGLLLSNGESITELVSVKQSRFLQGLVSVTESAVLIDRLFYEILGRKPDNDEISQCMDYMSKRAERRYAAIEGMSWALITSAEFRFNH